MPKPRGQRQFQIGNVPVVEPTTNVVVGRAPHLEQQLDRLIQQRTAEKRAGELAAAEIEGTTIGFTQGLDALQRDENGVRLMPSMLNSTAEEQKHVIGLSQGIVSRIRLDGRAALQEFRDTAGSDIELFDELSATYMQELEAELDPSLLIDVEPFMATEFQTHRTAISEDSIRAEKLQMEADLTAGMAADGDDYINLMKAGLGDNASVALERFFVANDALLANQLITPESHEKNRNDITFQGASVMATAAIQKIWGDTAIRHANNPEKNAPPWEIAESVINNFEFDPEHINELEGEQIKNSLRSEVGRLLGLQRRGEIDEERALSAQRQTKSRQIRLMLSESQGQVVDIATIYNDPLVTNEMFTAIVSHNNGVRNKAQASRELAGLQDLEQLIESGSIDRRDLFALRDTMDVKLWGQALTTLERVENARFDDLEKMEHQSLLTELHREAQMGKDNRALHDQLVDGGVLTKSELTTLEGVWKAAFEEIRDTQDINRKFDARGVGGSPVENTAETREVATEITLTSIGPVEDIQNASAYADWIAEKGIVPEHVITYLGGVQTMNPENEADARIIRNAAVLWNEIRNNVADPLTGFSKAKTAYLDEIRIAARNTGSEFIKTIIGLNQSTRELSGIPDKQRRLGIAQGQTGRREVVSDSFNAALERARDKGDEIVDLPSELKKGVWSQIREVVLSPFTAAGVRSDVFALGNNIPFEMRLAYEQHLMANAGHYNSMEAASDAALGSVFSQWSPSRFGPIGAKKADGYTMHRNSPESLFGVSSTALAHDVLFELQQSWIDTDPGGRKRDIPNFQEMFENDEISLRIDPATEFTVNPRYRIMGIINGKYESLLPDDEPFYAYSSTDNAMGRESVAVSREIEEKWPELKANGFLSEFLHGMEMRRLDRVRQDEGRAREYRATYELMVSLIPNSIGGVRVRDEVMSFMAERDILPPDAVDVITPGQRRLPDATD